jgi:hypothetical protein
MKVTKTAISNFIKASSSRFNEYPKKWVVDTIYGVLTNTEERQDLYRDMNFTFGQYTENRKTSCTGRDYFFDYKNRTLEDSIGNKISFNPHNVNNN